MSSFESSVTDKVIITEEMHVGADTMQGMNALIHWLKGFEAGGNGVVPGHFELVMHYRSLMSHDYERRRREADELYKLQEDDIPGGVS